MFIFAIIALILVCLIIVFLTVSFIIATFGGGPFVPTPMHAVHEVLKQAGIKKGDRVFDIGAGDGRFVHFAEKLYSAHATGIELDPFIYFLAKLRQKFWGWKGKIIHGSSLKQDLSSADIVICYMLPEPLKIFQKKFDQELKKGAKVVSYAFSVGDWSPTKTIPKTAKMSRIYIYER